MQKTIKAIPAQKLAVLGPAGTYSDLAAQKYITETAAGLTPVYFSTIDDTVHAVGTECAQAVVPIENMLDGYVQRTLDLMRETSNHIVQEVTIPVSFALIGHVQNEGEIKRLFVQPTASGQCRGFIDSLSGAELVMTESNIQSFNLMEEGHTGDAAIVPCHMLQKSGKKFTIANVTDTEENFTRFVVLKSGLFSEFKPIKNKNIHASLFILPDYDRPGLLFEILEVFYKHHVNLVSVISRPTQKRLGFYNFYIEVNGTSEEKDSITHALSSLQKSYPIKILGVYSA